MRRRDLKEGEAADEELEKLKKGTKGSTAKSSSSSKKGNGCDEDHRSTWNPVDETDEAEEEDDVQWQTDT